MNHRLFSGGLLQGTGADGIDSTMYVVSVGPLTDKNPDICSCDELVDKYLSSFLWPLFPSSSPQLRNYHLNSSRLTEPEYPYPYPYPTTSLSIPPFFFV